MFAVEPAFPCSTFVLRKENVLLFGKNWDFYTGRGIIVINKRGIEKSSLVMPHERPAEWVSKYGSVTFNQLGREFPYGGMNEKGLVIEIMWLDESVYPAPDERPTLNEVQWIQYQLDNCETVEDVIESMKHVRIGQNWSKIHYLVCDRPGNVAAIEFVDGKSVIHMGGSMPVAALTNSTYDDCERLLRAYEGFNMEERCSIRRWPQPIGSSRSPGGSKISDR